MAAPPFHRFPVGMDARPIEISAIIHSGLLKRKKPSTLIQKTLFSTLTLVTLELLSSLYSSWHFEHLFSILQDRQLKPLQPSTSLNLLVCMPLFLRMVPLFDHLYRLSLYFLEQLSPLSMVTLVSIRNLCDSFVLQKRILANLEHLDGYYRYHWYRNYQILCWSSFYHASLCHDRFFS